MASLIPGTRFVELAGVDHAFWLGDFNAIVDQIELLLTGARRAGEAERTLYTILFTDIVGSIERAAVVETDAGRSCSSATTQSCESRSRASGDGV